MQMHRLVNDLMVNRRSSHHKGCGEAGYKYTLNKKQMDERRYSYEQTFVTENVGLEYKQYG